ncbi:MAG: winged helix-turn-helix transcriptional regulator [Candidatus Lokiarchaeota archaeon]|nr:winged helix-turn-helix transcriptional regulator [Candidatus Lokiarchaeota archaeon]
MKISIDQASSLLKALADKSRLQIIDFLSDGERNSKEIEDALGKCQSTTSQHLKLLVETELLSFRQDGLKKYYKVNAEVLDFVAALNALVGKISKHKINAMAAHEIKDTLL